ncbi:MAG TPA: fibronectin type III domain-containing protein [Blastocatellia bacterium]|nr:fibronectin type III domain-containing protein [Blastocatellia bacterium]
MIISVARPEVPSSPTVNSRAMRLDVLRVIESRTDMLQLDEESFLERAQVAGSLSWDEIEQAGTGERILFEDGPLTNLSARYLYAARWVGDRGRPGPLSSIVVIEATPQLPLPPRDVQARDAAQDVLIITWMPPEENLDGSRPARVVGYNVYRRRRGELPFTGPLNGASPVAGTEFTDRSFDYGTEYEFMVRSVASVAANDLRESTDSVVVTITPRDVFPPDPPEGLTVASANGLVSLFWTPNSESDIAGYNIYRADSLSESEAAWRKINPSLHVLTTFRDDRVEPGRRYYYRVTAVDRAGNESRPSVTVSQEVVPEASSCLHLEEKFRKRSIQVRAGRHVNDRRGNWDRHGDHLSWRDVR